MDALMCGWRGRKTLNKYHESYQLEKVEIDYLQKKNVKKPNKGAPGFVVYYTNYSLTIHPDITGIKLLSQ